MACTLRLSLCCRGWWCLSVFWLPLRWERVMLSTTPVSRSMLFWWVTKSIKLLPEASTWVVRQRVSISSRSSFSGASTAEKVSQDLIAATPLNWSSVLLIASQNSAITLWRSVLNWYNWKQTISHCHSADRHPVNEVQHVTRVGGKSTAFWNCVSTINVLSYASADPKFNWRSSFPVGCNKSHFLDYFRGFFLFLGAMECC